VLALTYGMNKEMNGKRGSWEMGKRMGVKPEDISPYHNLE
jgi:hypothetical protein